MNNLKRQGVSGAGTAYSDIGAVAKLEITTVGRTRVATCLRVLAANVRELVWYPKQEGINSAPSTGGLSRRTP